MQMISHHTKQKKSYKAQQYTLLVLYRMLLHKIEFEMNAQQ